MNLISLSFVMVSSFNMASCQHKEKEYDSVSDDVVKPLILTPLIQSNRIKEARERSKVHPFVGNVTSNSGFFTVNEKIDANLFFWFFQKTNLHWEQAPVLLWLQGGPGSSSMTGVFTESGPYRVIKHKIKLRKYSWTNDYNVLFIDNPINSGFSFAHDHFVTNGTEITDCLHEAILQFFLMYAELRDNEFYIIGESYAGKFTLSIAHKIYHSNAHISSPINLRGLLIGNGFLNLEHMLNYAEHIHRLGLIDYRSKIRLESLQNDMRILIRNRSWNSAIQEFFVHMEVMRNTTEFKHLFYYLYQKEMDTSYIEFLQNQKTKDALHVGHLTYVDHSKLVLEKLMSDVPKSTQPWFEELIERYPILIYNGMADVTVGHFLTTDFLNSLHWSGADLYSTTARQKWYVEDRLAGYLKASGNLKHALIRNAGHTAPTFQPQVMLDLVNKFINMEL